MVHLLYARKLKASRNVRVKAFSHFSGRFSKEHRSPLSKVWVDANVTTLTAFVARTALG
jgi:hypothetical protein